jgi:hypothetical protein
MRKLLLILAMILIPFTAIPAFAGDVNLKWDPPDIITDVTGYRVHWGAASRVYSQSADAGNALFYTVKGLPDGVYYFAVTAYNAAKYQSLYSNEVNNKPPGSPRNLITVEVVVTINSGNITSTMTTGSGK